MAPYCGIRLVEWLTGGTDRVKVSGFKHDEKMANMNDFVYGPRCGVCSSNDGRHWLAFCLTLCFLALMPVPLCFNLQSFKQHYLTLQAVSFPSPRSGVTCILHGLYNFLSKESVYPAVACLLKFGSRRHWKRHNHKQEKVWTPVTFVLEPLERGFSGVSLAKISLSVL